MTHIVSLEAENFKRLKAVRIEVDGEGKVVLAGNNAQGKSSVLDAIFAAVGGRAGKVDRPVRDGASKGHVTVELDDIVVTRKFTQGGGAGTLEVKSRDGNAKFSSPQKVLDKLIGSLSFDPLAFAEADERKQLEILKGVVDLDVDLDKLAKARKAAYEQRTETNRMVKRLKAIVDEYDGPTVMPDVDSEAARDHAMSLRRVVRRREELLSEHARLGEEIKRLMDRQSEIIAEGRSLQKVEQSDVDLAEQQYAEALQAEAAGASIERFHSDKRALAQAEQESKDLTDEVEQYDRERERALAAAKFPVEGLSFGEEGVLWNDVPFSQASSAERIRVSVAMAMALNPELRVILIENASLLDRAMLQTIQEMADARDYQIWYEVVGDDAEGATVVIEDGEVKA